MDVLTPTGLNLLGVRGGQARPSSQYLHGVPGIVGPSDTFIRTQTHQAHVPWPGAVLTSEGKWHGAATPTVYLSILDHTGNVPGATYVVADFSVPGESRDPKDEYTCEICFGSGQSMIWTTKMHKDNPPGDERGVYPTPLSCTFCAGKGTPPIPWGELNGR